MILMLEATGGGAQAVAPCAIHCAGIDSCAHGSGANASRADASRGTRARPGRFRKLQGRARLAFRARVRARTRCRSVAG